MRKRKRAARVARTKEKSRVVLCKTATWNYHISGFDQSLVNNRKSSILLI